ncbi:MAG TPA: MarC family transcriptional regulator [Octadecabacter sp.]|nr:MarC family transcriptional regulator [Octadecabacter sp.]
MDPNFLITAFVALFVVIDPIGLAPLFVALTAGMSQQKRRAIAVRSCTVSIGILLLFAVFGTGILTFAGISMPAFRIAGGILLFITALDMLFERRQKRREDTAEEEGENHDDDPSVFPLAIPLIAGPGAIATIILLVGQTDGTVGFFAVMGVLLAVLAIVFILFLGSSTIERLLGKTGITVVTRLLGMLLAALSVQFVLDGLSSFGVGS